MSSIYLENLAERQEKAKESRRMNSVVRIARLKSISSGLWERYPFTELILFGSTASLTADESSDIDLYAPGLSFSQIVQLMTEIEWEFKTSVDVLYENVPSHVLDEIHRTGIRLFPFMPTPKSHKIAET